MTRLFASLIMAALFSPAAPFAQETPQLEEDEGAKFEKAPDVRYGGRFIEQTIEVEKPVSRSEARPFALMRGLDKISGRVTDIRIPVGEDVVYERLTITVTDCREPPEDEAQDAFVFLKVRDAKVGEEPVFSGWMFASSPALSAMDHQRYDLWVLSCATS